MSINSLVQKGKEVTHHDKDRSGNGQEDLTDVQRSLIQVLYSYSSKKDTNTQNNVEIV